MTDSTAPNLRGPGLRDRLHEARVAVRDALAANPSIPLRDEIAAVDADVTAAMLVAIAAYDRIAAEAAAPPALPKPGKLVGVLDDEARARLPAPRVHPPLKSNPFA